MERMPPRLGTVVEGPKGRSGKVVVDLLSLDKKSVDTVTRYASDQTCELFRQTDLDTLLHELKSRNESTEKARVIWDAVDTKRLNHLGSLRAAALIELGSMSRPDHHPGGSYGCLRETLRQRCARDLHRATTHDCSADTTGGFCTTNDIRRIPVLYRADKLTQTTGIAGRLVSGVTELPTECPAQNVFLAHSEYMPVYCATRSVACSPKWYKEFVRPDVVSDFDRTSSFPAVVAARYPDLNRVEEWCRDKGACMHSCGLAATSANIAALKRYCNSAAGSGSPVEKKLLEELGLEVLPSWCFEYREQMREAAQRDVHRESDMARTFESLGFDPHEVRNKVHYVCNSRAERIELDAAVAAVEGIAEVISLESDGCPCIPIHEELDGDKWRVEVLSRMDAAVGSTSHSYKAYRGINELLAALRDQYPDIPDCAWETVDTDWLHIERLREQCYKRLSNGERPVLWLKDLVPWHVQRGHRLVQDVYRCIPASKDSMEWWRFDERPLGGFWNSVPPPVARAELEEIVLDMLCMIRSVSRANAPADFIEGKLTASVVSRLSFTLYDATFAQQINGTLSKDYVQFGHGEVLTREHTIEPGRANLYIGRCTGFPFPERETRQLEESLAARGLSLLHTLRRVKEFEKNLVVGEYSSLPEDIVRDLEAIANEPGMEILQLIQSVFEDWVLTIFRGGKCVAAAIFAETIERFVVDLGKGSNGKTLLQRIAEVAFGGYAEQIKESMMTKDPPPPGSACPDLLQMRGVRYLCTPEVETSQAIKSSWIKKIPDAATKWGARDLYSSMTIHFRLWATFFISANTKLSFTIVDGGVERRCLACPYELKFVDSPTEPDHRHLRAEVKDDEWLQPRIPGFWLWIRDVHRAFFLDADATRLRRIPQRVIEATSDFLAAESSAALRDFLDERTEVAQNNKDAVTKSALLAYLRHVDPFSALKPSILEDTVCRTCDIVTSKGIRDRVRYKLRGGASVFVALRHH